MFIIGCDIGNLEDWLWCDIDGIDILVELLVFLGQHGVEGGEVFLNFLEFFNSDDALDIHVLGDFDCIGAPRCDHCRSWSDEEAV